MMQYGKLGSIHNNNNPNQPLAGEVIKIMSTYRSLDVTVLDMEITYETPVQYFKETVNLDDSALEVMTDLSQVTAVSVNPCASILDAVIFVPFKP